MKRLIWFLLRPFVKLAKMFFDPRFGSVQEELAKQNVILHDLRQAVEAGLDFARLTSTMTGREIVRTRSRLDSIDIQLAQVREAAVQKSEMDTVRFRITRIDERLRELALSLGVPTATGNGDEGANLVENLTASQAELLNFAESHLGFAAQRNLWVNDPVTCLYQAGDVTISNVTERILEVPFALAAVGALATGASVLDVGCAESLLALQLASLGYRVTGIDLRKYPFEHDNLEVVVGMIEEWGGPAEPFDGIICLSSIEHFGLGAYGEDVGDPLADKKAMALLKTWIKPDGTLILSVPFGAATDTPTMRVYNTQRLDDLLEGWVTKERRYARRTSPIKWEITSRPPTEAGPGAGVVMLTAVPG